MSKRNDEFELVNGTGNVFADLGRPNAEREHLRALLASEIIGVLDKQKLSLVAAEAATGVAATEFSRIRRVKLERFTIDRLMTILEKLDQKVEIELRVTPRMKRRRRIAELTTQ